MTKINVSELKWSSDYSLLKCYSFNRDKDQKRVTKIAKLQTDYGFVIPILVSKDHYIIDGQHRYSAAKLARVEYCYIILDSGDGNNINNDFIPKLISSLNSSSKNWAIRDYFEMWFKLGKKEFIKAKSCYEENGFNFKEFCYLIRDYTKFIRSGEFVFRENIENRVKKMNSYFTDIFSIDERMIVFKNNSPFRMSLILLCQCNIYSHKRFLKLLSESSGEIPKKQKSSSYANILEEIYNFRLSPKKRIRITSR